jgi:cytochrome b
LLNNKKEYVPVWDIVQRVIHWSLVLLFVVNILSTEYREDLHEGSGYLIAFFITVRIAWGFIGSHYARFDKILFSPRQTLYYFKALYQNEEDRYLGHNPAGALMLICMFILFSASLLTGMGLSAIDGYGMFANTFIADWRESTLEDLHETSSNLLILFIIIHIGGVTYSSITQRESLITAMFTGKKIQRDDDTKHPSDF